MTCKEITYVRRCFATQADVDALTSRLFKPGKFVYFTPFITSFTFFFIQDFRKFSPKAQNLKILPKIPPQKTFLGLRPFGLIETDGLLVPPGTAYTHSSKLEV